MEAALAAHLNGKFFWEHTNKLDATDDNDFAIEIRKAQKAFAKGAKNVTTQSKTLEKIPQPKTKPKIVVFTGERKLIEPIVNAICQVYGVPYKPLFSRATSLKYRDAKRHLCWALFRYIPSMSYPWAGDLLGKNHSTILHGRRQFEANQDFEKVVEVDRLMGRKL